MPDISVSYKGSSIATADATGTTVLETSGKYCEDDITISYTKPSGGSGVGNLTVYESYTVTPSNAAELAISHGLNTVPKFVKISSQSASGSTSTIANFVCDQIIGSCKNESGLVYSYLVIINDTGSDNGKAYLTNNNVVIRRYSAAITFSTSISYTIELYA